VTVADLVGREKVGVRLTVACGNVIEVVRVWLADGIVTVKVLDLVASGRVTVTVSVALGNVCVSDELLLTVGREKVALPVGSVSVRVLVSDASGSVTVTVADAVGNEMVDVLVSESEGSV